MKFYFPTSTLNFDAIYSSMSLMPPRYHCDEAIWFPRYFKTDVDLSDEVFVFYSSPISWEISDYDSENYPMLIEIDSSIVERILPDHAHTVQKSLTNGISCVVRNFPIVFNANDILSGCVKILFRTPEEKRTLVTRARIGVSESKLSVALKSLNIDMAYETFPNDVVRFDSIKTEVLSVINSSGLMFHQKDFEEFERQDRITGAIAGFHAGKWLRSMRDGYCMDCFRNGLDYFAWKKSLPNEFAAIIDMLCGMIGFRWDVNRDAIVDFCTKCWKKCFESNEIGDILRKEQWHVMLRYVAKSHRDVTFSYPVSDIKDCHMQALACFINGGRRHTLIANSIANDNVEMPELTLALHGALVGYSALSRVIFEKRSFAPSTPPPPPPPPLPPPLSPSREVTSASSGLSEWMKRIWEAVKVSKAWSSVKPQQQDKKKKAIDKVLVESKNEDVFFDRLENQWGFKTLAKEIKRHYLSAREGLLFENSMSSEDNGMKSILSDNSWITAVVEECVSLSKARAALKKDLEWYIEEREKKDLDSPEYAQQYVDQSNSAVINRVREFLENQKYHPTVKQQQYHPDKIKAYQDVDIERVIQWLRDRFGA